jgi:hypothetical protein
MPERFTVRAAATSADADRPDFQVGKTGGLSAEISPIRRTIG